MFYACGQGRPRGPAARQAGPEKRKRNANKAQVKRTIYCIPSATMVYLPCMYLQKCTKICNGREPVLGGNPL
nr:MAG TPA: hypothetical protein [Bacteriophage sp.]